VQDPKVKVVLIQRNGEIEALYASASVELLCLDWRTESPTRSVLLTKVDAGPLADLPGSALELLCTRADSHPHRGDRCPLDLPEQAATPTIPLTDELREILRRPEARRVQPFGRPSGPEEAILCDPSADEPHALHDEVLDTALLEGMHRAGVHPALIHAYQKTGRVVTVENQARLKEEDREEWHEAVDDWYARQGQGEPHSE
jgi:hypothetical protein